MTCTHNTKSTQNILNVASYRFVKIDNVESKVAQLKAKGEEIGVRGTIILSPEGINIMLAGTPEQIRAMHIYLGELDAGLANLDFKESWSSELPFRKYMVKFKKEIIKLGLDDIQPLRERGPSIEPEELKRWYETGKDFTILDTRNDYEVRMGTFERAVDLKIQNFTDFPEKLKTLPEEAKEKPLVMFCTGGIRCERASLVAIKQGFKEVYQLEGGILRYFEKVGGAHYNGECFVFDYRVGVDPQLQPTKSVLCWVCGNPLSVEDQKSDAYQPLLCCPYCPESVKSKRAMYIAKGKTLPGAKNPAQIHRV
jgi:predicted sulfurtransferase